MGAMTQSLYFTGPRDLDIRDEPLRVLGPDDVLIEAITSGISAGGGVGAYGIQGRRDARTAD